MWFALGLFSLTALITFRIYRKLHWSWGWENDHGYLKANGKPYKLGHTQSKGGNHTYRFGVVCPKEFHFRIKRETNWDRGAKAVGLSVEQCFNDPDFDETFYVISDNPALIKELSEVPAFRADIMALFSDRNLQKLACEGQHLIAQYRVKTEGMPPKQYQDVAAMQEIATALHGIADTLKSLRNSGSTKDPHVWKAVFLVSLASGVLILGIAEIFRFAKLQRYDPLLSSWPLLRDSAIASFILLAAWLALTAKWLRGSSHAHIVMGEVLVSGGVGLLMCSYLLARDLNCEWDNSSAKIHPVEVIAKYHHSHRKSPDTYSLSIQPFTGDTLPNLIDVTYRDYAKINEHSLIELHIKPGLIGYPWVEKIVGIKRW